MPVTTRLVSPIVTFTPENSARGGAASPAAPALAITAADNAIIRLTTLSPRSSRPTSFQSQCGGEHLPQRPAFGQVFRAPCRGWDSGPCSADGVDAASRPRDHAFRATNSPELSLGRFLRTSG